jgi:site-specific DNA-cytosine methylase
MIKTLELFSGTGSFGKIIKSIDGENISLDICNKFKPDINIDILKWDYKVYPPYYFDCIWASPPCTEYSKAKSRGIRDIKGANQIVLKVLEIIDYFKPELWFIENPQTSLLKKQPFMIDLENKYYYYDADYCMYGKPYRKRTRFWTNKSKANLKLCDKKCGSFIDGRHVGSCGTGGQGKGHKRSYSNKTYTVDEKHSIPLDLLWDLIMEYR